jgi:hypothetical protein
MPRTTLVRRDALDSISGKTVVVMPLEVEIAELVASGTLEPDAEWSAEGKTHLVRGLESVLQEKSAKVSRYAPPANDPEAERIHAQLQKLHGAVARAILANRFARLLPSTSEDFDPVMPLPSARKRFDWSLGHNANALRDSQSADYALFVFMRDGFHSGGRVGAMLLGTLVGVAQADPIQAGYASLVDLRSGDVVWFRRSLVQRTPITTDLDLRDPDGAAEAARMLLANLPLATPDPTRYRR